MKMQVVFSLVRVAGLSRVWRVFCVLKVRIGGSSRLGSETMSLDPHSGDPNLCRLSARRLARAYPSSRTQPRLVQRPNDYELKEVQDSIVISWGCPQDPDGPWRSWCAGLCVQATSPKSCSLSPMDICHATGHLRHHSTSTEDQMTMSKGLTHKPAGW